MERVLTRPEWIAQVARYTQSVRASIESHLRRRSRKEVHPVYDFLFDYYSFRPGQLRRWSPGAGIFLADATAADEFLAASHLHFGADGARLGPFPSGRKDYVQWAIDYLRITGTRKAHLGCAGMHEWAMLYKCDRPRHLSVKLRISSQAIDAVIERMPLTCTHFDAFRFFAAAARPKNHRQLARVDVNALDQPGCIHVTMDLYRFCYKVHPWISSDLLGRAFHLAKDAREIDMRASPYDLAAFGFVPIPVETKEGQALYIQQQVALAARAANLRKEILSAYEVLIQD